MKPKGRRCVFCGAVKNLTREHVLPEWVAKHLKVGRIRVRREASGRVQAWDCVDSFGLKARVLCKKCNSGWLNQICGAARPTLRKMFLGTPVEPTSEQLLAVIRWFWKVALLHEHTTGHSYFHDDEYTQFMATREVPQNAYIQLVSHTAASEFQAQTRVRVLSQTYEGDAAPAGRFSVLVLQIGQVVAEIVHVTFLHPSGELQMLIHPAFDGRLLPVWPRQLESITWPTPNVLSDRGYEGLSERLTLSSKDADELHQRLHEQNG